MVLLRVLGLLTQVLLLVVVSTHYAAIVASCGVTHVHTCVVHGVTALIEHVGVVRTLRALVVPEWVALHVGVHLLPTLHVHVVRLGLLLLLLKMMLLVIMHLIVLLYNNCCQNSAIIDLF